jgi:hypothetical protein
MLFNWIQLRFASSAMLGMFSFTFFQLPTIALIVGLSVALCACGSFSSTRRILHL